MGCSMQELQCYKTITRLLWVVNLKLMAVFMTNFANLSNFFVQVLWVAPSSLTRIFLAHGSLLFSPFLPWPSDIHPSAIPCERGKSKRVLAYYIFRARRLCLSPSSTPMPPTSISPILVGSPSMNSPFTDQIWMGDEIHQVYIEEEFPLVPPQSPLNSLLITTTYLHASLLHSSREENVDPTLVLGVSQSQKSLLLLRLMKRFRTMISSVLSSTPMQIMCQRCLTNVAS